MRIIPVAVAGGALGAALLLCTPAEGFEKIVPLLLAFASVAILLPRGRLRETRVADHREHRIKVAMEAGAIFLITIYGGYFGAAAGVLLLALLLRTGGATLAHANAAKNVILGVANSVAAVAFIVVAPVYWPAVIPLGAGCLIGSRLGPVIVRRAPATPLRFLIGAAGVALADQARARHVLISRASRRMCKTGAGTYTSARREVTRRGCPPWRPASRAKGGSPPRRAVARRRRGWPGRPGIATRCPR